MHSTKLVYAENLGADFLNFVSSIKALDVLIYRKTIFGCVYIYIYISIFYIGGWSTIIGSFFVEWTWPCANGQPWAQGVARSRSSGLSRGAQQPSWQELLWGYYTVSTYVGIFVGIKPQMQTHVGHEFIDKALVIILWDVLLAVEVWLQVCKFIMKCDEVVTELHHLFVAPKFSHWLGIGLFFCITDVLISIKDPPSLQVPTWICLKMFIPQWLL